MTCVTSSWRVETDRTRCIGSGTCAFAVPEVFDVDASGKVVVVGEPVVGDERVRLAVEGCPTDALVLTDEETA